MEERIEGEITISMTAILLGIGVFIGFFASLTLVIAWPFALIGGIFFGAIAGINITIPLCIGAFVGGLPMWWLAAMTVASSSTGIDWVGFVHLIPLSFVTPATFLFGAAIATSFVWIKESFFGPKSKKH